MRKILSTLLIAMVLVLSATAQTKTISGRVLNDTGTPVQGVSVTSPDNKTGTQTNAQGNFSIAVNTATRVLTFSSVGLKTKEVSIGSQIVVNVTLLKLESLLEDVVVSTGYGTKKRTEFTGASTRVGAKNIEQLPLASFEQALQGQAPGVYIASGSGQPGSTARVNIRGVGSFGNVNPLYVLDGIRIEDGVFRTLNANDFESVEVLKDAAGTSLYGSAGANGVVVITSKKGRPGKTLVAYRAQTGFSEAPQALNLDMMNTAQRLEYEEKILGPGGIISSTALTGYPGWDYSPSNPRYATLTAAQRTTEAGLLDSVKRIDTDWPSLFFRRGNFTQHEVNASGGSQGLSFYTSLGYYKQEGVLQRSNVERYTFRTNLDFKANKLSVSVRSAAGFSLLNGIESEAGVALANPIAAAYLELPYRRAFLPDGKVAVGTGNTGANAYDRANTSTALTNQFKGNLGVTIKYDIWGGIVFRSTNGVDWRNNNSSRFIDPNSFAGTLQLIPTGGTVGQGLYNEGNAENLQLISTTGFEYSHTFNEKHSVKALALMESIRNRARNNSFTGYGINPRLLNTPSGITAGSAGNNLIPLVSGGRTLNGLFSLIGGVDYTYDKRITVSGSIRSDASSQLPEKNRTNVYWTTGLAWNIISEKFMETQNIFQDLRLRASYGEAANTNGLGANFGYISTYSGIGSAYGTAIAPSSPGNEDYKLESQLIKNIGFEFSMWNNRLRIVTDYFQKDSKELFLDQQITRTSGFGALRINAGEMRNTGFEFDVKVDAVKSKDVLITFGVNGAPLKNRITSLGQLTEIPGGTGISRVGLPFGTHYTVGYLGIDPQSGLPVYEDLNGNPTTIYNATNSRAVYGTFLPTFTGGASIEAAWKGFSISALFYTAQGVQRFNNESFFYETTNSNVAFNKRVEMLNTWTKPGDITNYQRVSSPRQFSSKDVRDASFVRFRNLTASYVFKNKSEKYIRSVRVWGQGQNLYTWTKWTGFDPEESNNIATYEFPNPRTYTIGIDVNF